MMTSVSIVICCHNSAKRLPSTLAHLAAQKDCDGIPWEVIVVDNASKDDTAKVALSCWPKSAPAPLKVVHEPRLGLAFARERGFSESRYEVVSFIDDDNWVYPDWVKVVSEVMEKHPEVGACGGFSEAVCEVQPPWWFERFKGSYAIGAQGPDMGGDITWTRGFLWGAGLTIRKAAWQELVRRGFRPFLTGRKGRALTAGEDSEICFALRLAGWRLWYEPGLRLAHFLPAHRLQWRYLRRLHRGFGASTVGHDAYHLALKSEPKEFREKMRFTWQWQVLVVVRYLIRCLPKLCLALHHPMEGDPQVLKIEAKIGRLFELLQKRGMYDLHIHAVRHAPWRKI